MADTESRAGKRYADAETLDFLAQVHHPSDEALSRAFEAADGSDIPAIQVGAAEGRLLGLLLGFVGAKRVVEVGTLVGYSTIWMARALPPDGRLWSIEAEPKHAALAREHLELAGLAERATVVEGDAVEVLASLEAHGPFCAVFLDADKGRYDVYGRWAAKNLRQGGLLLGDNAYLFGELLSDTSAAGAMRRFHRETAERFDSVCVPTPDGLVLGIKR